MASFSGSYGYQMQEALSSQPQAHALLDSLLGSSCDVTKAGTALLPDYHLKAAAACFWGILGGVASPFSPSCNGHINRYSVVRIRWASQDFRLVRLIMAEAVGLEPTHRITTAYQFSRLLP